MTILDIAKECSRQLQIPVPTAFVAATSNNQVLLKAMIYKTIQEISDEYEWPELQREYLFKTIAGQNSYPLPLDFDSQITFVSRRFVLSHGLLIPLTQQLLHMCFIMD